MNATTILAIANSIIAGCALGLTASSAYATRRHNRLSVTPRISRSTHRDLRDEGMTVGYDLINVGLGPALITRVTLFISDSPVESTGIDPIESWVRQHVGDRLKFRLKNQAFPGQRGAIRAGEKSRIAEIFFPDAKARFEKTIEAEIKVLAMRVEYESFYGDRYVFDTRAQ